MAKITVNPRGLAALGGPMELDTNTIEGIRGTMSGGTRLTVRTVNGDVLGLLASVLGVGTSEVTVAESPDQIRRMIAQAEGHGIG